MLNTQRISANSNTFRTSEPKNGQKKTQLHEAVAVRVDDGFGFFLDLQLIRFLINPECWRSWEATHPGNQLWPPALPNHLGERRAWSKLVGGWPTPLKNISQMGVWNSQYMESHKIHVPNHQPALGKEGLDPNLVSPLKDPRCCNAKLRPCSLPGWHWWLGICSPWLVVVGLLLF